MLWASALQTLHWWVNYLRIVFFLKKFGKSLEGPYKTAPLPRGSPLLPRRSSTAAPWYKRFKRYKAGDVFWNGIKGLILRRFYAYFGGAAVDQGAGVDLYLFYPGSSILEPSFCIFVRPFLHLLRVVSCFLSAYIFGYLGNIYAKYWLRIPSPLIPSYFQQLLVIPRACITLAT